VRARLLQTLLAIATRVALIDVQRRNVPSLLWFFSASAVLRAMTAPATRLTTQGLHAEVLRFAHGVRADVAVLGRLVQGGAIAQEEVQEEEEQVGVVKIVVRGEHAVATPLPAPTHKAALRPATVAPAPPPDAPWPSQAWRGFTCSERLSLDSGGTRTCHRPRNGHCLFRGASRGLRLKSISQNRTMGFVKMGKLRSPDRENTTEKRAQEEGVLEGFSA
jgi:hypothetical protein